MFAHQSKRFFLLHTCRMRSFFTLSNSSVHFGNKCLYCGNSGRNRHVSPFRISSAAFATSSGKDYYSILGASRSDSTEEIKKKYRKLAKQYHPDTCTDHDAKDKFQQVSEAWDCLKDDSTRKLYDAYGHEGYIEYKKTGASPGAGAGTGAGGINMEDIFRNMGGFEDLFGQAMGRGRARGTPRTRGRDIGVRVDLTFAEAINGCSKTLSYEAEEPCSSCNGKGTSSGYAPEYKTCQACNGAGVRNTVLGGMMQIASTCDVCYGSGQTLSNPCPTCSGTGLGTKPRDITVEIPPGVDTGMQLSQQGGGSAGERGGPSGDLIISINVAPDKRFTRDGMDIYYECPITLGQSLLGDSILVPTIGGEVEMKVTPFSKNGDIRRLRGKGVPQVNNPRLRGDQYVKMKVELPKSLTPRQRQLILEFEKEELSKGDGTRHKLSKLFKDAINQTKVQRENPKDNEDDEDELEQGHQKG